MMTESGRVVVFHREDLRVNDLVCHEMALSPTESVHVSPATGDIIWVGNVPLRHRPAGSSNPSNHDDVLWALKGAGTQVGIVLRVVFRTFLAYKYAVHTSNGE